MIAFNFTVLVGLKIKSNAKLVSYQCVSSFHKHPQYEYSEKGSSEYTWQWNCNLEIDNTTSKWAYSNVTTCILLLAYGLNKELKN